MTGAPNKTHLRVAVVGTRGVPGVHGGVERHAEELYQRLAKLGVEVTVYARGGYGCTNRLWRGVRVKTAATVYHRNAEALSHTVTSLLAASRESYDLVHFHSIGPASLIPLARLLGMRRTVLTVHAFDYDQSKWGGAGRAYLRLGEQAGVRLADGVVAVSEHAAHELRRRYRRKITYIPNGPGATQTREPGPFLQRLGLLGSDYILFVGRLVPGRRVEDLIAACLAGSSHLRLVVAGDSSYTDEYAWALKERAGHRVQFVGYVGGADLEELYSNALMYVLPSESEGLSISLLEAMSCGLPIVASDIPGNREALGDPAAGLLFPVGSVNSLAECLHALSSNENLRQRLGAAAAARVRQYYDWDDIAERTLAVYEDALSHEHRATG